MDAGDDIAFIVNPASGRGRGANVWDRVAASLRSDDLPHRVSFTRGPGEATALARKALEDGADIVVSVGGDGTAHEVVNGFFDQGRPVNPSARIAFVAAGTGNDAARVFELREDASFGKNVTHVDLLRVRHTPSQSSADEHYALFHVGVGLVTEVVETSNRLKDKLGRFVYAGGTAVALYRHRPRRIDFSCDEGPIRSEDLSLIMVSNARYAGGGMMIAPPASMQDGLLDVITLRGRSKFEMLFRLLPAVYRGAHMGHPAVGHVQARTILIESDEALSVALDGELTGTTPVWIDVLPRALPVCLPIAP